MVKFVQHAIILWVYLVIQETIVSVIRVQTIFGMELIAVRDKSCKKLKLIKAFY